MTSAAKLKFSAIINFIFAHESKPNNAKRNHQYLYLGKNIALIDGEYMELVKR